MRSGLFLLPLSFLAAPAIAQPAPAPVMQVPPETADRLADSMQSLSDALLDLKVGGIQAALQGRDASPAERNVTVRDLARRDDPQIDRDLHQRIAEAKPKIEQSIRAVNEALPQITESLQRAQKAMERAIANMPDPNYPRR